MKLDFFITESSKLHNNKYSYEKIEWKNSSTKVCIICPIHGEFWQRPYHHIRGEGCPKCARMHQNDKRKITKDIFLQRCDVIFGKKYDYSKVQFEKVHDKITIICPRHGEFIQEVCWHLNGHGCSKCAIDKTRLTNEDFRKRATKIHHGKYDYSKTQVFNSFDKLTIICPKHGEFLQSADTHLKGCGCPICGHISSKGETEIYEYVCDLIGKENVKRNERDILRRKEIDIYIPFKRIGIEYNGIVWHSEKFGKDSNYHVDKLNCAMMNNIQLIQIFEDEYLYHKDVVLNKIKYILGCTSDFKRISAKHCHVAEISEEKYNEFLKKYSICNDIQTDICLGLIDNDTNSIVSIMCFRKCKNNVWIISGYIPKSNEIVHGGGGKIFKYFITKYLPQRVVTYVDRRWQNNIEECMFTKIGFKFDCLTKPKYQYVIGSDRKHYKNDTGKSFKIYDCGYIKYIWTQ